LTSQEVVIEHRARHRMAERGASEAEVVAAVTLGETFPTKLNRVGFRRNFSGEGMWRGRPYATKQLEVLRSKRMGVGSSSP
jgi:hypothetical protein